MKYINEKTEIPSDVWGFINLLYNIKIIPRCIINAEFMNKYRPDILWEEYKVGCGKSYDELIEHFKDTKVVK